MRRRGVNPVLTHFWAKLQSLLAREEGQTMAEYGVVLAVITIAVIGAITLLAGNVSNALNAVANIMP